MKNIIKTPSLFQVAEVSISYKPKVKSSERPKIGSSRDAYRLLLDKWDEGAMEHHEEVWLLLLDRANKVMGIYQVSKGGIAGTICDPKVVFQAALKANASSLIVAHNHPSGVLKPSQADLDLTKKLVKGGQLLDISVHDHLILSAEGYLSMADEGLM